MCGIAALSRTSGKSSIPDARHFVRAAALAVESRGRHATGFGWHDQNEVPWYWKEPGPASRVAKDAPLPSGMRQAIVHTRHATLGSPKVNGNNHPVVAPGVALVHNGRIENHRALTALSGLPPTAEVDSESLALLLSARYDVTGGDVLQALEMVEGVAAIAWLEQDDRSLHLARLSTRPMTIGWTRRGDFVMSSTPASMQLTSRLSGVAIGNIRPIPEGTLLRVVDGAIMEESRFTVQAPPQLFPDDAPAPVRRDRLQVVENARERRRYDMGIDWENMVGRRGWK